MGCSKTTEILNLNDRKWVQGPELPVGIKAASCVALPLTSRFACVVVGGRTMKPGVEEKYSSNVYGLERRLMQWKFLGKLRKERCSHISLPIS